MAAHTYWRIYVTATGHVVASIAEFAMFDSSGTYLCTGGTPSASSTYPGQTVAMGFDNNTGTFWSSNGNPNTTPEWLSYQFASAVDVASVMVTPRLNFLSQGPYTFKIQYSDDGSTWTDATGSLTATWPDQEQIYRSYPIQTPATDNYLMWRWVVNTVQVAGQATNCAELIVRAVSGGSDIGRASGTQYIAHQSFSGVPAPNAFDGNAATLWGSTTTIPAYLGIAFPKPVKIVEFVWTIRNDAGWLAQSPITMDVQGSNDGGNTWTTIGSATAATWTTVGQSQTFTVGGAAVCVAAFRPARLIGSGIYV
jgi:hypothetical protein